MHRRTTWAYRVIAQVPIRPSANWLLVLHHFIDNGFSAFVHGDDFVDGDVAAHGDVDDVVAGIEQEVDGRVFVQHVLVDGHLGSLGLSLDTDGAHTLRVFAAEQLLHSAGGPDVVDI